MSVLIKGMDMPETCLFCPICHMGENGAWDWCEYFFDKVDDLDDYAFKAVEQEERPDFCPLVEVKTPHGRLIDADAHLSDMEHGLWDWESVNGIQTDTALRQSMTDIRNAPTVIEAETKE